MGGKSLKHVVTERKNREDYCRIKQEIISLLSKHLVCDVIKEAPEKETYGDLDVLYVDDDKINITDLIKELYNPKEIFENGDVISFDYDNFQIDFIKSYDNKNFMSKIFFFSYGDLGSILGKMVNFYEIKFGQDGLWIDIGNMPEHAKIKLDNSDSKVIMLTQDSREICTFMGLDYSVWEKGFTTTMSIFEWIASSKYFNKQIFITNNHKGNVRIKKRAMYKNFMEWLCLDDEEVITIDRVNMIEYAIDYFDKKKDLEAIINKAKVKESRNAKYSGKLFIDHGIKPIAVNSTKKLFEEYIQQIYTKDFYDWLDSSDKSDVLKEVDAFFKK